MKKIQDLRTRNSREQIFVPAGKTDDMMLCFKRPLPGAGGLVCNLTAANPAPKALVSKNSLRCMAAL